MDILIWCLILFDFVAVALISKSMLLLFENVWSSWYLLFPFCTFVVFALSGMYNRKHTHRILSRSLSTLALSSCAAAVSVYILLSGRDIERIQFVGLWVVFILISLTLVRFALRRVFYNSRHQVIVFVGSNTESFDVISRELRKRFPRVKLVREFSMSREQFRQGAMRGWKYIYDETILKSEIDVEELLSLKLDGYYFQEAQEFYADLTGKFSLVGRAEGYLKHLEREEYNDLQRFLYLSKDFISQVIGCILIVVLAIPIMIIFVLVKILSPGPAFYVQQRLGKNKVPFMLYKFRTMSIDAEKNGMQWASLEDSRVTGIGKVMRALHLDELPQVLNLVKGDLNIVGPRPIRQFAADIIANEIPCYNLRFLVKPGITGWAQALGPYGHDIGEIREKTEYDLYYVLNRHNISDITICVLTLHKITRTIIDRLRRVDQVSDPSVVEADVSEEPCPQASNEIRETHRVESQIS